MKRAPLDARYAPPDTTAVARRASPAESCALVARQPIYGTAMSVIAYELRYAQPDPPHADPPPDAAQATLRMIADAALEIGLDRLGNGLPVHIHHPRELLLQGPLPSVQPERVTIEVVEDIPDDRPLIEAIQALRARGHRIALANYSPRVRDSALLHSVDLVKIDVREEDAAEAVHVLRRLQHPGLQLIATEVATIERFEYCAELGFDGFQGEFLQHPQTLRAQRLPTSRLNILRLLAELQNDNCAIADLERLVAQDVSLSYRVLRCINSSYYSLPKKIDSIRQAIVILGLDNLRQLCALVSLHNLGDRPASLFVTAMARARMCEQLGRLNGAPDPSAYFITGLFSMLDVLTAMPLAEIVGELPLARPIARALTAEEGALGAALRCTRAYERAAWNSIAYADVDPSLIRAAYVDAVFWAEQARAMLTA